MSDPVPSPRLSRPAGPPFRVVYADPPWRLPGGACLPYPTLSPRAVCALPVADVCADDCALLLWAGPGLLPDALAVIAAWGFAYRTVGFVWAKANRTGPGFFAGRGGWTRQNAEVCLLGTQGHPRRADPSVAGLVVSPRREHSRKPDEVRERIVSLLGDVPQAELFARQKAAGWAAWGNEVECDFDLGGPVPAPYGAPRGSTAGCPPPARPLCSSRDISPTRRVT